MLVKIATFFFFTLIIVKHFFLLLAAPLCGFLLVSPFPDFPRICLLGQKIPSETRDYVLDSRRVRYVCIVFSYCLPGLSCAL